MLRLKNTISLDFFVPDHKGSHLSQLNPKPTGILLPMGNPIILIKLENLMGRYGMPFFQIDWLTGELYSMEGTSMTLISERATIILVTIPQVLPVVSPAMVLDRTEIGNVGGIPQNEMSRSSSCESGFSNIDLTQGELDEVSKQKILPKKTEVGLQIREGERASFGPVKLITR